MMIVFRVNKMVEVNHGDMCLLSLFWPVCKRYIVNALSAFSFLMNPILRNTSLIENFH